MRNNRVASLETFILSSANAEYTPVDHFANSRTLLYVDTALHSYQSAASLLKRYRTQYKHLQNLSSKKYRTRSKDLPLQKNQMVANLIPVTQNIQNQIQKGLALGAQAQAHPIQQLIQYPTNHLSRRTKHPCLQVNITFYIQNDKFLCRNSTNFLYLTIPTHPAPGQKMNCYSSAAFIDNTNCLKPNSKQQSCDKTHPHLAHSLCWTYPLPY
jgi:hypothetical protein